MNKKVITYLGVLVLLFEIIVAAFQYYNSPIDPDLPRVVLPHHQYKNVLKDPTGFKTIEIGLTEAGTGRFFAHQTMYQYYLYVPLLLQKFVSPIGSVYLSSALFMLMVHLLTLYVLSLFATNEKNPFTRNNLLCYVILAPLFMYASSNYSAMGLIDRAPTYVYFYIWPITLLFWVYIRFFNFLFDVKVKGFSVYEGALILALLTYIIFSGSIIVPILGFWNAVIILGLFWNFKQGMYNHLSLQKSLVVPVTVLCLSMVLAMYNYYLGSNYNAEFEFNEQFLSVPERYIRLVKGIGITLLLNYGYPTLLLLTLGNLYFISKYNVGGYLKKYKWFLFAVVVFIMVYLVMLPLGGYRPYRPYMLRNDTFLPVTFITIVVFIHTLYYLIKSRWSNVKVKSTYLSVLGFIWLVLYVSDMKVERNADCEKAALTAIYESNEKVVRLPFDCLILGGGPYYTLKSSEENSLLMHRWNIMKKGQRVLHIQE